MNSAHIPWPCKALSPNARVHYMQRHRAVRQYRFSVSYLAHGQKRLRKPVCAILPLVGTRRRRDLDNVLASLKSALDGLTDAGWWDDDHDIVGYHMIPEVYSKLWSENRIVILAEEEEHLDHMQAAVARFRAAVANGEPHAALANLLADVQPI